MDHHGSTAFIAAASFLAGGLLAELVQSVVAVVGGTTALGAAVGRYLAVLRGDSKAETERATGVGFAIGLGIGVLILIADALFAS